MGKDQTVSVSGDGEVGPHEIANGRLRTHWFDPGGYCCLEGLIIFVNKVDQVREVARAGEGEDNRAVNGNRDGSPRSSPAKTGYRLRASAIS